MEQEPTTHGLVIEATGAQTRVRHDMTANAESMQKALVKKDEVNGKQHTVAQARRFGG